MNYRLLICLLLCLSAATVTAKNKVLIFSKTAGFHHASIPTGIKAITKLGEENNFDVDTTIDAANFTYENLKKYAAVISLKHYR